MITTITSNSSGGSMSLFLLLLLLLLSTTTLCCLATASPQQDVSSSTSNEQQTDAGPSFSFSSSDLSFASTVEQDRELTTTIIRRRLRHRNRAHQTSSLYRAGYFSDTRPRADLTGLNDFVRPMRFEIGSLRGRSIPIPSLGSSVVLRSVECGDLEVEDLTHDYYNEEDEEWTVMEMAVQELLLSCSAGYRYETGSWWKPGSHSGTMELKLSSSWDTRVGLRTTTLPAQRARVLSCASDTRLGITLQKLGNSRFLARLLNGLLTPLQGLFQGELRDIVCEFWEQSGGEMLESLLRTIRRALEPYYDGTNDIEQVDRTKPQRDVQERLQQNNNNNDAVAVTLMDYTDTQGRLDFDDFDEFANYFQNVVRDLCGLFQDAKANRPNRALQDVFSTFLGSLTTTGELSTIWGVVIKAVSDILVGLLQDLLGDPEDIIKLLYDFITDIFEENELTATLFPPNVRRRVSNHNHDNDDHWSLDLGNLLFSAHEKEEVPVVVRTDNVDFSLRQAILSGSPVRDFRFAPVDAQTLNVKMAMDDVDASFRLRFDLHEIIGLTLNNHGLVFSMPSRVLDFTVATRLRGVELDTSILAAVPFLGNSTSSDITMEQITKWMCAFFPDLYVNYFSLELLELIVQPIFVEGFLGGGMDEFINSVLGQFVSLFQSVLNEVVTNYFGTTFLSSSDEILRNMLDRAKLKFDANMCDGG